MGERPLRVVVLCGGPSHEHTVSLRTGAAVAAALQARGLEVLPVRIERDGRWLLDAELPSLDGRQIEETAHDPSDVTLTAAPAAALAKLELRDSDRATDVVFIALHGPFGEDGTVQGLLQAAGLAYTGSGVAASALAMDKERTKEVLAYHGVRSAPWVGVRVDEWRADPQATHRAVATGPGYPVVVKPTRDGSSFGVSLVDDADGLAPALNSAFTQTGGKAARALVEARVSGTEVSCPVIGNRGDALEVLPVVEIVPQGRTFFDFAAKYQGASDEICPARIPDDVTAEVQRLSLIAHRTLGCDGLSRSDFIIDADGTPWFLETNTIPGMTPQSLVPRSASAVGIDFDELCERLVRMAVG